MQSSSFFRKWYGGGVILLILMVSIGGITRLTNSGLSIVSWEPITGIIPPLSESDWGKEFNHYKDYPEYKFLNRDISLDGFKIIYFWEYIHRMFGRLIALYFIIPFLYLSLRKNINSKESFRVLILITLIGIQGLMGWYMVQSGLVDNPHVSHIRLMIHLLAAMILLGYTYIQYLRFTTSTKLNRMEHISRDFSLFILFLVCLQISYGAFTAGLKAGYAYNTFPLMNGSILPAEFFSKASFLENILYEPYTIQFIHRLLGTLLLFIGIYLIFLNIKSNKLDILQSVEIQLSGMIILQFFLGVLTLLLKIPLYLAIAHQLCACFVLILSVKIVYNTISSR